MQCEDNSKLRTPLNEVCMTTDIGCVPIVNGQPTCKPQPDELPIAFDPSTTTLWLFSCDTREWIAFQKFQVCQLSALNLDNIKNICDVLNIAVNYGGSGECVQGTVTLGELAQRILECLQLDRKIITIGQGEGNKVKISIEGLPLDPVYVTGVNIWSEGGSGSESDPLIVATYDPICKWPVASQSVVDAATTKHLGACLDGQPSRVPYPPKPCEYPQKTQEEVDAATSKNLIACVNGEAVKIPYPKYQPPVCEANQLTLEQASAAGSSLTLLGCEDNTVVRIPVSGSGFFDRDYICVPSVTAAPTSPPLTGTGPLRVGCNGELYVWLCEESRWEEIKMGNLNNLDIVDQSSIGNICENFNMLGWYSADYPADECVKKVKLTLGQLAMMVKQCTAPEDHIRYVPSVNAGGGLCILLTVNSGIPTGVGNDIVYGYSFRDGGFVMGSSTSSDPMPKGHISLNITNPWLDKALLEINAVTSAFSGNRYETTVNANPTVYANLTENFNSDPPWSSNAINTDSNSIIIQPAPLSVQYGSTEGLGHFHMPGKTDGPTFRKILNPNESITVYGFLWFIGVCTPPADVTIHARMYAGYTLYRYAQ